MWNGLDSGTNGSFTTIVSATGYSMEHVKGIRGVRLVNGIKNGEVVEPSFTLFVASALQSHATSHPHPYDL